MLNVIDLLKCRFWFSPSASFGACHFLLMYNVVLGTELGGCRTVLVALIGCGYPFQLVGLAQCESHAEVGLGILVSPLEEQGV